MACRKPGPTSAQPISSSGPTESNAALPSAQFLPPGSVSYVDGLKPPTYDPDRARQLLADAGFPKGLRITLHGPINRYVNDTAILQAIALPASTSSPRRGSIRR